MSSYSDTSSELAGAAQQEEWDEWEENEGDGFKSLFSDARFETLQEVLQNDEERTGFNLQKYRMQHGLDQLDTIRLINYIRSSVAAGQDPVPALQRGEQAWRGDAHLQPVLPADDLLLHDWEGEEAAGEQCSEGAPQDQTSGTAAAQPDNAAAEVQRLRAENEALRGAVQALRGLVLQEDGLAELVAEAGGGGGAGEGTSVAPARRPPAGADPAAQLIDASYFDSYSAFDIHRDMLADRARTEAYRDALEGNPALVGGARVLDLGCGTGILSMFAARGGAAAVVGVDGSEQIAGVARANVEANGLAASTGGPVTVVGSRVEQLGALPLPPPQPRAEQQGGAGEGGQQDGRVDVLVSEWMGYALLFESMLSSVLHARDRWLRPGGALLPDIARLHLAAAGEGATGLDFWRDVYGFSMEAVRSRLAADGLKRAMVRPVSPQHLLSEGVLLHSLDLATMAEEEQDFAAPFTLEPGAGPRDVHALVLWFDTLFSQRFCAERPVTLSTSPLAPPTHWAQTVLLLRAPLRWAPRAAAGPGDAVALTGQLSMSRSRQTHRSLDIVLRYTPRYADGTSGEEQVVLYGMGVET